MCRVKLIEGATDYILYQWQKNLKAIVAFLDESSEPSGASISGTHWLCFHSPRNCRNLNYKTECQHNMNTSRNNFTLFRQLTLRIVGSLQTGIYNRGEKPLQEQRQFHVH